MTGAGYWFWVRHDRHLTPARRNEVVAAVAESRRMAPAEIMSPRRTHRSAHARQEVMWKLRSLGFSSAEIGRSFGMHHTTVLHGLARHWSRLQLGVSVDAARDPSPLRTPGIAS